MFRGNVKNCTISIMIIMIMAFWVSAAEQLEKARSLMDAKKYQEAESALRDVLAEDPNNSEAHYLLGLTLLEQEKFKEAEETFTTIQEGAPKPEQIRIGLARAFMGQGELEKSRMELDEAQKIRPESPDVYYYRGMLDGRRKDYAASAANLERCLELDPQNAYAHYYAALAYNQVKKPDKMVQHFQAFLKLAPDAPEANKVRSLLRTIR